VAGANRYRPPHHPSLHSKHTTQVRLWVIPASPTDDLLPLYRYLRRLRPLYGKSTRGTTYLSLDNCESIINIPFVCPPGLFELGNCECLRLFVLQTYLNWRSSGSPRVLQLTYGCLVALLPGKTLPPAARDSNCVASIFYCRE
jgi:hypothetical protein